MTTNIPVSFVLTQNIFFHIVLISKCVQSGSAFLMKDLFFFCLSSFFVSSFDRHHHDPLRGDQLRMTNPYLQ